MSPLLISVLYDPFSFGQPDAWDLFTRQHGPHHQGTGYLLTWFVNRLIDWDQRAQCSIICTVAFASAAAALWLCSTHPIVYNRTVRVPGVS